ncbi:MAG: hypothetical protein H0U10_03875 [Chloroflexia bacterium]|nr:hypothetical protein [Chloroflexia bacterium]
MAVVADVFGVAATLAPFQLPGGAVYQMTVGGTSDRPALLLTLWPTIRRLDAIGPAATVVFTRIAHVDLVADIEALFRRETGEYLIVTVGGKVIVRS